MGEGCGDGVWGGALISPRPASCPSLLVFDERGSSDGCVLLEADGGDEAELRTAAIECRAERRMKERLPDGRRQ